MLIEIRRVLWDNKRNYGSLRIWNQLRNEKSFICSVNRVARPNNVWVGGITYIWTYGGWLYLAVVLELYSRGIVGAAMGNQYASNDFKSLLAQYGCIGSMSGKGDCWDNAVAESFFHTLKVELIRKKTFRTREEAM